MKVFFVELQHARTDGRRPWRFFECDCEDVAALTERLNAGHMVPGFRLWWKWTDTEDGRVREVTASGAMTLRLEDVYRVAEPHGRFVRFEGEAGE